MNSKSIWKKVVCIALAFCFCAGLLPGDFTFNHLAYAEDVLTVPQPESDSADEGGWLYRICDDGFAEVTGYSDNTVSALTIPSSLGGAWVVRIAPNAFADNVALETISIPATVAEINASAFPNHTNLTVRAANGTMALRFAAQRNFDAVNTSKYDFFDDILDLSEMKKAQFNVTGNTATIGNPYALQLETGKKLFLPPNGVYTDGLPFEITAVKYNGTSAVITFVPLDFTETVETYCAENVPLTPDYDNVIILADGFQLIQTQTRGEASVTLSPALTFAVDRELFPGAKVKGSITYGPKYTFSVEYGWFEIQKLSYTNTTTTKLDIGIDYSIDFYKEKDTQNITFARIPMTTPALVSVWLDVSIVISLEGEVTIESSLVTTENFKWSKDNGFSCSKSRKVDGLTLNAAVSIGTEFQAAIVVNVGFAGFDLDVAKVYVSIGVKAKVSSDSNFPDCGDLDVDGTFKVGIKIGILSGDKPKVALNVTPINLKWDIWDKHIETRPFQILDECTRNQKCTVQISAGTTYFMTSFSVDNGSYIESPAAPVRAGYIFTGWYKDSACTTKWNFATDTVTSDITLYAGWKLKPVATTAPAKTATPAPTTSHTNTPAPTESTQTAAPSETTAAPTPTEEVTSAPTATAEVTPAPTPSPTPTASPTPTPTPDPEEVSLQYLVYEIANDKVTITGYTGEPVSLTIPQEIEGYAVTAISGDAFENCDSLTYVRIPDSVTTIGGYAFGYCDVLTEVILPSGWDAVSSYNCSPFVGCEKLCSITVPEGATTIPSHAFHNMTSLVSISLPSTLEEIGNSAFSGCTSLETVDIPEGVTYISGSAFNSCTSLETVSLPKGLKTISGDAFENCDSLTCVRIPDSVTTIGGYAFGYCDVLTEVILPSGWDAVSSYNCSPFVGCEKLCSITVPEGATTIPSHAFHNMTSLVSISLPSTLEEIGNSAFSGCTSLTLIALPPNVSSISSSSFDSCSALKYAYTHSLDSYAAVFFAEHYPDVEIRVRSVSLCYVSYNSKGGSPVSSIYATANALLSVPASPVRTDYTFAGWYKDSACTTKWDFSTDRVPQDTLTLYAGWKYTPANFTYEIEGNTATVTGYTGTSAYITLPDACGDAATTALAEDAIPSTVRSVHIPASITDVDPLAFRWAENLGKITVDEDNPVYCAVDGVLYTIEGTLVAYPRGKACAQFAVKDGTIEIGSRAFYNCDALKGIVMPSTIAILADMSIYGCDNLTSIVFAVDPTHIGSGCFFGSSSDLFITGPLNATNLAVWADNNYLNYNEYTVTYMQEDELLGATRVRAGSLLGEPMQPDEGSLTFRGWSTTADGKNLWDFSADEMPQSPLTLYAVWRYDFTTAVVEGGVRLTGYTGSKTSVHVPESIDGLAVVSIAEGAFPDPSVTLIGNKGSVTEAFAIAQGMRFAPLTYTVTFVSNGGTHVETQELTATQFVTEPDIVRTGYTLLGWYTDSDLTHAWNFDVNAMAAADLTLYAGWEKNDETVADIPFTFKTTADGLVVTGYTGSLGTAEIPEAVNGIPVVAIADYAFYRNDTLLQVTIPGSVKSIGDAAFAQSHIGNVILEYGVTDIGEYAFADCVELSNISFANSVTSVGRAAFQNCTALTRVALPDRLTSIEESVFSGCTFLNAVELPTNLETIASASFADCTHLTSVNIGAAVSDVAVDAFSGCTGLSTLDVSASNLYYSSMDGVLFSKDGSQLLLYPQGKKAQSYTVPETVTAIGAEAMSGSRITALTLNENLTSIGTSALQSSMHLEKITFAASGNLTVIGDSAFSGCFSLTEVSFPDSLTYIGAYAFSACDLTSVEIPAGVTIGNHAFSTSDSLTIYGDASSAAAAYAQQNGIRFIDPSANVAVNGVSLPEELTMNVGDTTQLIATLTPDNTTETSIIWDSSDASVVFVDTSGLLSARYVGTATITATAANGSTAICTVTVERSGTLPEEIVLSDTELSLAAGMLYPLSATVLPEGCLEANVTWTTSDSTVAMYVNGCVSTLTEGSATLTASTANGMTATCTVTIYPAFGKPDMTLPASLTAIDAEAFCGLPVSVVSCPNGLKTIGARAFANCASLQQIWIPVSVTSIDSSAFDGCSELLIYGEAGSAAEEFANHYGFTFVIR